VAAVRDDADPELELMADPRYRAIIDAREFPDATPPVKVSVSVWGLGALHVFTGLGATSASTGSRRTRCMEIGNAFCEAARIMHTDEVTPMTWPRSLSGPRDRSSTYRAR
jgi:hypothetical protein